MKKIIAVLSLFTVITVTAQKSDAPAAVKAAFTKAHPGTTAKWEKEDGNYEASFEKNGNKLSAIYNAKGTLLESEIDIKVSELPASVASYMKAHYKSQAVTGAAKITKADGSTVYEAAIKGKDVLFDASGKFIKEAKD